MLYWIFEFFTTDITVRGNNHNVSSNLVTLIYANMTICIVLYVVYFIKFE